MSSIVLPIKFTFYYRVSDLVNPDQVTDLELSDQFLVAIQGIAAHDVERITEIGEATKLRQTFQLIIIHLTK